jgi:activator of HSP90 ATPase
MENSLTMSVVLPATSEQVYTAWLSTEKHSAFTGSPAAVDARVGGTFTAWDGYIGGTTLALTPYRRIVQAWRTTEFPGDAPDSGLEILIEPVEDGTRLTLDHRNIPAGQADEYRQGWEDFYFGPLTAYFAS